MGDCAKCGGVATRRWKNRSAMQDLELCETDARIHDTALNKGNSEWKEVTE